MDLDFYQIISQFSHTHTYCCHKGQQVEILTNYRNCMQYLDITIKTISSYFKYTRQPAAQWARSSQPHRVLVLYGPNVHFYRLKIYNYVLQKAQSVTIPITKKHTQKYCAAFTSQTLSAPVQIKDITYTYTHTHTHTHTCNEIS